MRVVEHPFSDLLRSPKRVVRDLADSDVLLRRRGAPALRLSQADRDDDRTAAFDALARLLRNLAAHSSDAMAAAALEAFAWLEFLPEADQAEFLAELPRTLLASAEIDNYTPVSQMLAEWRATAEVHADPKLARRLGRPIDADGERVTAPAN
jgi:Family of unknown function (DUF6247)